VPGFVVIQMEAAMKKLPIGIQTFRDLREDDYVYADKTKFVYDIINSGAKAIFLSRPRRFGKSLFADTVKEAFSADRSLFEGLFLGSSDWGFEKHPVIRIDMTMAKAADGPGTEAALCRMLEMQALREGLELAHTTAQAMFERLILLLSMKYESKVVAVIDEYDKPILDHITEIEKAQEIREVLRGFYGILKSADADLRLVFITGVTKFTQTSIFSGLNNLKDITFDEKYANICGFTEDEFDEHFGAEIPSLEEKYDPDAEEIIAIGAKDMRQTIFGWYDGYSWDGESRLFNPFSVLSFFDLRTFVNFWFATGTPKFLIDLIMKNPYDYFIPDDATLTIDDFDVVDPDYIELVPLLFQTGYLTVNHVEEIGGRKRMSLKMPNYEVRTAFNTHLVAAMTSTGVYKANADFRTIAEALSAGQPEKLQQVFGRAFASIPSHLHIPAEAYYHTIFYAIMKQHGFKILSEVNTADGRIDGVVDYGKHIYIIEMKYEKAKEGATAEEKATLLSKAIAAAFDQIESKGYARPYESITKKLHKVAFAVTARSDVKVEVR
jgi:hypothetical protein